MYEHRGYEMTSKARELLKQLTDIETRIEQLPTHPTHVCARHHTTSAIAMDHRYCGYTIPELAHDQWIITHQDDRHLPEVRRAIERLYTVVASDPV